MAILTNSLPIVISSPRVVKSFDLKKKKPLVEHESLPKRGG